MFFVGLAVGGGGVFAYHHFHERRAAEVFSRRLRCNTVANQCARKDSNDVRSVSVEMVGYSAVSNSCVAYFQVWDQTSPRSTVREWRVMDLLSGEVFYTGACQEERNCGDGNDMKLGRRGEVAFQQAVNGEEVNVSKLR